MSGAAVPQPRKQRLGLFHRLNQRRANAARSLESPEKFREEREIQARQDVLKEEERQARADARLARQQGKARFAEQEARRLQAGKRAKSRERRAKAKMPPSRKRRTGRILYGAGSEGLRMLEGSPKPKARRRKASRKRKTAKRRAAAAKGPRSRQKRLHRRPGETWEEARLREGMER